MKLLFVCLGNICRSPMAEAIAWQRIKDLQLENIEVDSAATSGWEVGNPPYHGTQKILKAHGIDASGLRSRKITKADIASADWVIAMDEMNVVDLKAIARLEDQEKIRLMMSVVPGKETVSIPDPYYTGDFQQTYQLINEAIDGWLENNRK